MLSRGEIYHRITKRTEVVPEAVVQWLLDNGAGAVADTRFAEGGCISSGRSLITSSGERFFLKTNPRVPGDFFRAEANGLEALRSAGGVRVPEAHLFGADFILLEDLLPAPLASDYWQRLGEGLATLHTYTAEHFGFKEDNYIGSTAQPNPHYSSGHDFFCDQRLNFQTKLAFDRGLLDQEDVKRVKSITHSLASLVPEQPASMLHGDLWSGNAISDAQGGPAIIDPAAYYGWAEADLAMTDLFGRFPEPFYASYTGVRPLETGFRSRFPIYNLYHLLNHLNLFGVGYLSQVRGILSRFS